MPLLLNPTFDATAGWECVCAGAPTVCQTEPGLQGPALVLKPRCTASQVIAAVDPGRALSVEVDAEARPWARAFLAGWDADALLVEAPDWHVRNATRVEAALATKVDGTWGTLTQARPLVTTDLAEIRVTLVNDATAPNRFDGVRLIVGEPNPPLPVGALVKVAHRAAWQVRAGKEAGALWVPLPMDVDDQTLLAVDLRVAPPAPVRFTRDELGNWAAVLDFPPSAHVDHLEVDWDALVLTRATGRPPFGGAADPEPWRAPSAIAQADHPGIVRTAGTLVRSTSRKTLASVVAWTSAHVAGFETNRIPFLFPALDAASVFRGARTSCTGYANLAAAVARAAGLPTRIVAGIRTGTPQQTHFVNESWLGSDWQRFEPQGRLSVDAAYLIALRRVLPADEGQGARGGRPFAAAGVPLHTLSEPTRGVERFRWAKPTDPLACAECDNDARRIATLDGTAGEMNRVFAAARDRWRATTPPDGGPAPWPHPSEDVDTLDEVAGWITPPR